MGCKVDKKRNGILGVISGSTTLSAFFSFFSLVPLGCCGSWLLVLSYLPTIFGSALSVSLIQYSKPLSYVGLIIVLSFAGISSFKLRSEWKKQHTSELLQNIDNKMSKDGTVSGG
jgi:membrane protein DedA with SNARE-associated domain